MSKRTVASALRSSAWTAMSRSMSMNISDISGPNSTARVPEHSVRLTSTGLLASSKTTSRKGDDLHGSRVCSELPETLTSTLPSG